MMSSKAEQLGDDLFSKDRTPCTGDGFDKDHSSTSSNAYAQSISKATILDTNIDDTELTDGADICYASTNSDDDECSDEKYTEELNECYEFIRTQQRAKLLSRPDEDESDSDSDVSLSSRMRDVDRLVVSEKLEVSIDDDVEEMETEEEKPIVLNLSDNRLSHKNKDGVEKQLSGCGDCQIVLDHTEVQLQTCVVSEFSDVILEESMSDYAVGSRQDDYAEKQSPDLHCENKTDRFKETFSTSCELPLPKSVSPLLKTNRTVVDPAISVIDLIDSDSDGMELSQSQSAPVLNHSNQIRSGFHEQFNEDSCDSSVKSFGSSVKSVGIISTPMISNTPLKTDSADEVILCKVRQIADAHHSILSDREKSQDTESGDLSADDEDTVNSCGVSKNTCLLVRTDSSEDLFSDCESELGQTLVSCSVEAIGLTSTLNNDRLNGIETHDDHLNNIDDPVNTIEDHVNTIDYHSNTIDNHLNSIGTSIVNTSNTKIKIINKYERSLSGSGLNASETIGYCFEARGLHCESNTTKRNDRFEANHISSVPSILSDDIDYLPDLTESISSKLNLIPSLEITPDLVPPISVPGVSSQNKECSSYSMEASEQCVTFVSKPKNYTFRSFKNAELVTKGDSSRTIDITSAVNSSLIRKRKSSVEHDTGVPLKASRTNADDKINELIVLSDSSEDDDKCSKTFRSSSPHSSHSDNTNKVQKAGSPFVLKRDVCADVMSTQKSQEVEKDTCSHAEINQIVSPMQEFQEFESFQHVCDFNESFQSSSEQINLTQRDTRKLNVSQQNSIEINSSPHIDIAIGSSEYVSTEVYSAKDGTNRDNKSQNNDEQYHSESETCKESSLHELDIKDSNASFQYGCEDNASFQYGCEDINSFQVWDEDNSIDSQRNSLEMNSRVLMDAHHTPTAQKQVKLFSLNIKIFLFKKKFFVYSRESTTYRKYSPRRKDCDGWRNVVVDLTQVRSFSK